MFFHSAKFFCSVAVEELGRVEERDVDGDPVPGPSWRDW